MSTSSPAPKKSLGQHWLHDEASLQAMIVAAQVTARDTVLEIGPGLGTLTRPLALAAHKVIAVEFDEKLAETLLARIDMPNVKVIQADILRYDLTQLPQDYKVVANIPYYLTSHLIRILSESINPPLTAALLIQKEVAERVAALPGDMSLLSVTAQFYWEVSLDKIVPAELFTPPPKVDSQIVVLTRRPQPLFSTVDTKIFFRIVKAGFAQRRKTLINSLSAGLHLSRPDCHVLLQHSGLSPTARAQTLSLDDWYTLYQAYSVTKI